MVLWLDDLTREAASLAEHIVAQGEGRILIISTARTEGLGAAAAAEVGETLEIEPLLDREISALARRLLGLRPELAADLASRAGGSPLFALQIVGAWLRAGALVSTPDGFGLAPSASLPKELGDVWDQRIEATLQGRPDRDRRALQLATLLGIEVDQRTWRRACKATLGRVPDAAFVDALLRGGLAVDASAKGRPAWRFVHGLLTESLRAGIPASDGPALHHACATALQRSGTSDRGRIALHLVEAGRFEEAIDHALAAAEVAMWTSAWDQVLHLTDVVANAADRLGRGPNDSDRITALSTRSEAQRRRGDAAGARATAEDGAAAASANTSNRAHGRILWSQGMARLRDGLAAEALDSLVRADGYTIQTDDENILLHIRNFSSDALVRLGRADEAKALLRKTLERPGGPSLLGRATVHRSLYIHLRRAGELDEAEWHSTRAAQIYQRRGALFGLGRCANDQGVLAEARGDIDGAIEHFHRSIQIRERCGRFASVSLGNLARLALLKGDAAESLRRYVDLHRMMVERGQNRMVIATLVGQIAAHAAVGEWAPCDELLDKVVANVERTPYRNRDTAKQARWAVERMAEGGAPELAKRMRCFATSIDRS